MIQHVVIYKFKNPSKRAIPLTGKTNKTEYKPPNDRYLIYDVYSVRGYYFDNCFWRGGAVVFWWKNA